MRILAASLALVAFQAAQPARPPMPPFDPENARNARLDDAKLAIEMAADPSIAAVPLVEGSDRYGFILDRLLTVRAAAVSAAKLGKALTAEDLIGPNSPVKANVFVVALPLECDGKLVTPKSIEVAIERGNQPTANMARTAPVVQPEMIASQAGVPMVPEGTLGQGSSSVALAAAAVRVTYDGPACPSTESTMVFRFKQTVGRVVENVTPVQKLPPGAKTPWPAVVRMGGWVDTNGRIRVPRAYDGPIELRQAAIDAAPTVRRPTMNINGVPVFQNAQVAMAFAGDGEPTAPVPTNPGPLLEPGLSVQARGGIPLRGTYDWYGVSLENSQCPVSTDKTYGTMPDNPIKTGGGNREGPARELAYLNNLRGGSGQGTRFRRLGSNRNSESILDIYEFWYDGMPKPVRLYLDEYNWEDPKAPFGLVCLLPVPLSKPGEPTVVK
jgi:hypothetical protein